MKTLTIIAPVYKEEEVISDFYRVLKAELLKLRGYTSTILFIVDKSPDNTLQILKDIAKHDSSVFVLGLSSRVGKEMSLLAGIDHADTDAIVMMDSDLQHPPEVISKLLAEFEKGNDIVYTIRDRVEKIRWVRKAQSSLFYYIMGLISEVPINPNAGDFRLISRRVARLVRNEIRERHLFLPGIMSWVGFNQAAVHFVANARPAGQTKFTFMPLVRYGLYGVLSFSKKPLRAAAIVGALFALLGFLVVLFTVIQYFTGHVSQPGFSTIVVLLCIFGGAQLIFLGIIGEYVGAIFDEVKGRPHYIIEDAINIEVGSSAKK